MSCQLSVAEKRAKRALDAFEELLATFAEVSRGVCPVCNMSFLIGHLDGCELLAGTKIVADFIVWVDGTAKQERIEEKGVHPGGGH